MCEVRGEQGRGGMGWLAFSKSLKTLNIFLDKVKAFIICNHFTQTK